MEEKGICKAKLIWMIICIILQIVLFGYYCTHRAFWQYGGDTWTYQITSLDNFSWYHRTVGYQFVMYIGYLLGGQVYEEPAYTYIVWFQVIMGAIANIALCAALWNSLKSKKFAVMFGVFGSVLLTAYGWSEILMPEPLAVSIMCIHIWTLSKALTTKRKGYFIVLAPIGLIGVLIRPSYIFIFAVLGVFFIIYFIFTNKKNAIYGLVSLLLCTLVILGYCEHNRKLIGVFCLSNVSYLNELTDLIAADIYENPDYPELTALVQKVIDEYEGNNWSKAGTICTMANNKDVVEYIKSCKRMYRKEVLLYAYQYAMEYIRQPIVEYYSVISEELSFVIRFVKMFVMPFSYIWMLGFATAFFIFSIVESLIKKAPSYMAIGISGCILAIYILSVATCHTAHLQRIAICIIPCMIVMNALILDKVIDILKGKKICGKK